MLPASIELTEGGMLYAFDECPEFYIKEIVAF